MCLKLTIKATERRHWRRSDVFIVNFKHILHLNLVFRLLTLNIKLPARSPLQVKVADDSLQPSYFLMVREASTGLGHPNFISWYWLKPA